MFSLIPHFSPPLLSLYLCQPHQLLKKNFFSTSYSSSMIYDSSSCLTLKASTVLHLLLFFIAPYFPSTLLMELHSLTLPLAAQTSFCFLPHFSLYIEHPPKNTVCRLLFHSGPPKGSYSAIRLSFWYLHNFQSYSMHSEDSQVSMQLLSKHNMLCTGKEDTWFCACMLGQASDTQR